MVKLLFLILILLSSCQANMDQNNKNSKNKIIHEDLPTTHLKSEIKDTLIRSTLKTYLIDKDSAFYKPQTLFEIPNRILDLPVTYLGRAKYINDLKGANNNTPFDTYAYTKQISTGSYSLYTLIIPEESCWVSMQLISISKDNHIIDQLTIADKTECGSISYSNSILLNDSTIQISNYPNMNHEILDELPQENIAYKKTQSIYIIKRDGTFHKKSEGTFIEMIK